MGELILIDGYNLLHQIPQFKKGLKNGLEMAREEMIQELLHYTDYSGKELWVVFDSNRGRPSTENLYSISGFKVIFTSQKQNADSFIERTVYDKSKTRELSIRVVSSDRQIQNLVLGKNVAVSTSEMFYLEMQAAHQTP